MYHKSLKNKEKIFAVAPMMDWTDRHCRVFHRQLTRRAMLYTEMLTSGAVLHGDREHLLGIDDIEHPVALQLGGSEPEELAEAARIGEGFGYNQINLNCGCPSDRVQSGRFGASLMAEPDTVARCVEAMGAAVTIPVTVKCRIGIDEQDSEADLARFIETVAAAGCKTFIVHARKAWLNGLSPKQNREIPPLDHTRVYRLKQARPDLEIVINGGIETLEQAHEHLEHVDGVMLGRAAYQNPWLLASVDTSFYGEPENPSSCRSDAALAMSGYARKRCVQGDYISRITRHMLGLFHGQPGGRVWRRHMSEEAHKPGAGPEVIKAGVEIVSDIQAVCEAAQ